MPGKAPELIKARRRALFLSFATFEAEELFKSDWENKHFINISNANTTRPGPFPVPDLTLFPFDTAPGKMLRSQNKAE